MEYRTTHVLFVFEELCGRLKVEKFSSLGKSKEEVVTKNVECFMTPNFAGLSLLMGTNWLVRQLIGLG